MHWFAVRRSASCFNHTGPLSTLQCKNVYMFLHGKCRAVAKWLEHDTVATHCSRRSMDRTRACGVRDVGSIPTGGTNAKQAKGRPVLHLCPRRSVPSHASLGIERRSHVLIAIKTGEPCPERSERRRESTRGRYGVLAGPTGGGALFFQQKKWRAGIAKILSDDEELFVIRSQNPTKSLKSKGMCT